MDSLEENTVISKPSSNMSILFAVLIIGAQVLVSLITYPSLPNLVPSHWNVAGQINGYMPRLAHAILFPLLSLGFYVLIRILVAVGPRLGSDTRRTIWVVDRILIGLLLFFLVLQLTITAIALHLPIDMPFVMNMSMAVLFLVIGNYMGKLRRNFWVGIRTPWTIVNETVWERTHRLGGWLFVCTGLLGVATSFIAPLRPWAMIAFLLLSTVILVVYSYVVYHQLEGSGKEPLSPPFDRGS